MNLVSLIVVLGTLANAQTTPPPPVPSASLPVVSPSPSASGSLAPTAYPSPVASNTQSPAASPSATAAPGATTAPESYKYRYVPRQPDHPAAGVPQIFAVYLNDEQLRSQGPISIKVTTSPDVVKVVSRNGGREGVIPEVVPGDFEAASKLPKVPFIASGMTLDLEFVATGASGAKTTVRVPVKLK